MPDKTQMLYLFFRSIRSLASGMRLPDEPLLSDIEWVLALMQSGKIRKGNGEAFAADVTFEQATAEIMKILDTDYAALKNEGPARSLIFPNISAAEQVLIIENDGVFEPFGFTLKGKGRDFTMEAVTASELRPDFYEKNRLPGRESRYFDEVRVAVRGMLEDLRATDSIFSSDSGEYKMMSEFLEEFSDLLNNREICSFERPMSLDEINSRLGSVTQLASAYIDKKMKQDDLSGRQVDRLSVCMRLKDLKNRVNNIVVNQKQYDEAAKFIEDTDRVKDVPGNAGYKDIFETNLEIYNAKKKQAEEALKAADNSLGVWEMSKHKTAHKILFANLKRQGPAAVMNVLRNQRKAEKNAEPDKTAPGLYDDLLSKIRVSDEYRRVIGETVDGKGKPMQYPGENTDELYRLSEKSPESLLKKFTERIKFSANISEKYTERPYQWKNSDAEKTSRDAVIQRIESIGNPGLAAICEYTLKLTDQMSSELFKAESSRHSDSYRIFRSQLNSAHNRIIKTINEAIDKPRKIDLINGEEKVSKDIFAALKNIVGDVSRAASDYQAYHAGITFSGTSENMVKRLEIATGVRVINDFLTDPANAAGIISGADYSLRDMTYEIGAYRLLSKSLNKRMDYHSASLDNLDHFIFEAGKSSKAANAGRIIGKYADYDSMSGFKSMKDDVRDRIAKGDDVYKSYKTFLEKDSWGKLVRMSDKTSPKQMDLARNADLNKNNKLIDEPVANNDGGLFFK